MNLLGNDILQYVRRSRLAHVHSVFEVSSAPLGDMLLQASDAKTILLKPLFSDVFSNFLGKLIPESL